jgi:flagellar motor switch protein FliG
MVTLDSSNLKRLLIEIIQAYASNGGSSKFSPSDLFNRLKKADDVSIQTLIQTADNDDIVALVKVSEKDEKLREKLYSNMSANSKKTLEEEVEFKFKDSTKDDQINAALLRLTMICNTLQKEEKANI